MSENLSRRSVSSELGSIVERVYREWDRAWSQDDPEALISYSRARALA